MFCNSHNLYILTLLLLNYPYLMTQTYLVLTTCYCAFKSGFELECIVRQDHNISCSQSC